MKDWGPKDTRREGEGLLPQSSMRFTGPESPWHIPKIPAKFEHCSPKLSSAEPFLRALLMLASTPTLGPCSPCLCPPLLKGGEKGRRLGRR